MIGCNVVDNALSIQTKTTMQLAYFYYCNVEFICVVRTHKNDCLTTLVRHRKAYVLLSYANRTVLILPFLQASICTGFSVESASWNRRALAPNGIAIYQRAEWSARIVSNMYICVRLYYLLCAGCVGKHEDFEYEN